MNNEDQEAIYCRDDGANRVHCVICGTFCIERFYENHLKSQTHANNFCKRKQLKDFK